MLGFLFGFLENPTPNSDRSCWVFLFDFSWVFFWKMLDFCLVFCIKCWILVVSFLSSSIFPNVWRSSFSQQKSNLTDRNLTETKRKTQQITQQKTQLKTKQKNPTVGFWGKTQQKPNKMKTQHPTRVGLLGCRHQLRA